MGSLDQATPAISVRSLEKRFGRRRVVDDLSFDVPTGAVCGFVGPNGSGKTTTLRMLVGLVHPNGGTGTVLGEPIDHPERYLGRVGTLIEGPAFYPGLSGRDNLCVLADASGHGHDRLDDLLRLVTLGDRGHDRYKTYSLGMKQRLGIAAAMIGEPELLILDEPTNGLDPLGIRDMRQLIRRLAEMGPSVFISSHLLDEIEQLCDWLVFIDKGALIHAGATADLLNEGSGAMLLVPEQPTDVDDLISICKGVGLTAEASDNGVVLAGDRAAAAAANRAAMAAGICLVEITTPRVNLEDRYLALTGGQR